MTIKLLSFANIIFISFLLIIFFKEFYQLSNQNNFTISNNDYFDVIVVLTGNTNRIVKGYELLQSKHSKKMFISGVNPIVEKKDIKSIFQNNDNKKNNLFDCCVFLGKNAKDTRSNAIEVFKWMKSQKLNSAVLITSDFHMPRSILEFKKSNNHIKIDYYPVKTNNKNFVDIFDEFLRFCFVRVKYLIF